ncbi:PREDICTED: peptidoglycan-recognition protein SC2-like [Nicrophorus vespilloides]|uniref:Peptidoglycan-recognition protein n=1 Tax=Nicrophorus vespilloides TaxID=110193 RepID=A0ABM1NGJ6_NICVS|nr:PREDICTED: peptidoglycan-recognition protein SC2-like [Nicrophorus vespilloides]
MLSRVLVVAVICFAAAQSLTIVSRSEWGAKPAKGSTTLPTNPPSHVVIHHASSPSCYSKADCIKRVKSFQDYHMGPDKNYVDIGYNFVVGEDGNVYEGRGWGKQGAHAKPLNNKSIGICVAGTFNGAAPNAAAQKAVKDLIAYGVANGKIQKNYKLAGHRQVDNTDCPGTAFFNVIKGWPQWTASP